MKYAILDTKTNQPSAFYDEAIHGVKQIVDPLFDMRSHQSAPMVSNPDCNIPSISVPISDAAWQAHIDGIAQVYDSVKKTWSAYVPTTAETLSAAKESALAAVNISYYTALDAVVTYNGALFQSDAKSVQTLSETLTAISNGWVLPKNFTWIDANNTAHLADVVFLQGLSSVIANHKAALFTRLFTAKQSVKNSTTQAAIDAVVL